jgi:hypothetical protein
VAKRTFAVLGLQFSGCAFTNTPWGIWLPRLFYYSGLAQIGLFGPLSPFAHVLIGRAHETLGGNSNLGISPGSASAFAAAVGAGIDIKVAPFASLRAIQLDYLVTRFGSATQNQPRASAGVALHF